MMRSMFSGVSGLRVHQTKMDVIANNISNVNTVGYKSSRVTFNEVFSQTLSGAGGPNDNLGTAGTNPMQIGLGANVASIDKTMTTGAAQRTDNPLDLMIQGDGMFVVGDSSGTYFTRAGTFSEDQDGNIGLNGMKLMGWDAVWDDTAKDFLIQRVTVKPLQITDAKEYLDPTETTEVDFSGNINPNTDPVVQRSVTFYDSIGTRYLMDVSMTYDAANSDATNSIWQVSFPNAEIYPNGDRTAGIALDTAGLAPFNITFDTSGHLTDADGNGNPTKTITVAASSGILYPAATLGDGSGNIILGFSGLNQFVNESTNALGVNRDGNEPGNLTGLSVGTDGKLTGRYSNGLTRLLGQIPLATFKNYAGLEKMGNNLFAASNNSGAFDGVGTDGQVQGGVLEMSNVDLSQEFTEMITTQRGFQANSRVITSSDTMLQELVNLVR
jgi:flagellar hook protein FlgE